LIRNFIDRKTQAYENQIEKGRKDTNYQRISKINVGLATESFCAEMEVFRLYPEFRAFS
jgi:hypothetical protein